MSSRNRNNLQSSRSLKKRRKKIIWVCVLSVVAVGSILTVISLLSKINFLTIQDIQVNATTTSITSANLTDEIRAIAEKNLVGNWWYLFSKANVLLYPKATIRNEILAQFPSIRSVSVTTVGLNKLQITAIDHSPYGLACTGDSNNGDNSDTENNTCFYIDSTGFVYAPAPAFSAGVYIKYYVMPSIADDQAVKNPPFIVGSSLTDAPHLATVKQALDYMTAMNLVPIQAVIANNGDYSVSIKNKYATTTTTAMHTREGTATTTKPITTIYFDTSASLQKTLEYFSKFWANTANKDFDYIDLRFGNDIVFKLN